MNSGEVVERPYREAVRLLSRRMADAAEAPTDAGVIPLDPEPVAGDAGEESVKTLDDLTKAQLVDFARDQGLPTTGNKQELIDRLSAAPVAGATPENVPGENEPSPDEQS